jgi:hypothetical protein
MNGLDFPEEPVAEVLRKPRWGIRLDPRVQYARAVLIGNAPAHVFDGGYCRLLTASPPYFDRHPDGYNRDKHEKRAQAKSEQSAWKTDSHSFGL